MTTLYGRVLDKRLLAIGMAALTAVAAFGEVIYENDFTTRTSAEPIPYGGWREVKYSLGNLVNSSGTNPFNGSSLQDNWILGRISSVNGAFVADSSNYELLLCSGEKGVAKTVCVKHRLGNTFTNGIITAQCDFKPPTSWQEADIRSVRFLLGDESFFSPDTGSKAADFLKYEAANVGVSVYTNVAGEASYKFFRFGIDLETATTAKSDVWYRAVVTANLDTKKYAVSIYDMSSSRPSLATVTPETPAWTETDLDFRSVTEGVAFSGISAVGLAGYGVSGTKDAADLNQAAQIDNVRVWHNGEECYQNVFSARRSRCFAAGTTAATYDVTGLITNSVKDEVYMISTNLVPGRVDNGYTVQPIGIDGWRRTHNKDGKGNFAVAQTSSAAYLRFSSSSSYDTYGFIAQPFGSTITSGKVRLAVDTRLPTNWGNTNSVIWVTLAGDDYYNATPPESTSYRWATVGIRKESGNTPTYVTRSSTNPNPTPASAISAGQWYRIVVTADLDNDTTEFSVYEQGPDYPFKATPDGTCIFTTNGIEKLSTSITSVSCFSLGAYYVPIYFDNVKIWHIPTGSATETLLYENYFTTRTCYLKGTALVGTLAENPVGIDYWTRIANPSGDIRLVDRGNPAVGFGNLDSSANYAAHDIGGSYKSGVLTTQFDMCAPSGWKLNGNGNACLWLGDSQYHEGNQNGTHSFYKYAVTGVGFNPDGFIAWNGDGVGGGAWTTSAATPVAGHWYRFVLTTTIRADKSDIAVYDMGTTQPTLATATPTTGAVAEFSEVPFRRNHASLAGVSSLGIQAKALNEAAPLVATDSPLLIDNIRISHTMLGFRIIIK